MPFVAGAIRDAIAATSNRIALENQTLGQVFDQLQLFLAAFDPIFDPSSADERVVRNWIVELTAIRDEFQSLNYGGGFVPPQDRQRLIEIVCRILMATRTASSFSLISGAQSTAVLTAWNNSFGALP